MSLRRRSPPPSDSHYDYLLKIILLGPSGSGKSSLLHYFLHHSPLRLSSQTIGVEFATKILTLGTGRSRRRVKLQLWDTAGTERFRSVSRSYYRGAAGAILVYDVRDERSFNLAGEFLRDARALGSRGLSVVCVGNKIDAETGLSANITGSEAGSVRSVGGWADDGAREREVSAARANAWAAAQDIPVCVETSAATGEGVEDVFARLARTILTRIEMGVVNPDDPDSGIQYGDDLGGWADGKSVRSGLTVDDAASLVAYSGQKIAGRGKVKLGGALGEWGEVFGGSKNGARGGGGCC
ncbi:ras-domain-containing protein [Myriangium duriaei CBS 260.36]|uniref:Ras-domain-containing protein n=1 Tax=Myriangium duriaei CBS 260.36 TaxID=1168546 RepID=A0A9P4MM90_9PEZI|nr:ras-domain-containing protein [Myriangium duriaei CBS 260.36]